MTIYLLERGEYTYDETASVVVVANSDQQAREIAGQTEGQSPDVWFAPTTKIEDLGIAHDQTPRLIHSHFHAG